MTTWKSCFLCCVGVFGSVLAPVVFDSPFVEDPLLEMMWIADEEMQTPDFGDTAAWQCEDVTSTDADAQCGTVRSCRHRKNPNVMGREILLWGKTSVYKMWGLVRSVRQVLWIPSMEEWTPPVLGGKMDCWPASVHGNQGVIFMIYGQGEPDIPARQSFFTIPRRDFVPVQPRPLRRTSF